MQINYNTLPKIEIHNACRSDVSLYIYKKNPENFENKHNLIPPVKIY